jgi:hypothetical protein
MPQRDFVERPGTYRGRISGLAQSRPTKKPRFAGLS